MYRKIRPATLTLQQDVIDSYWFRGPLGIWISSCGRCSIWCTRTKLWQLKAGTETSIHCHLWEAKLEGIRRIREHESINNAA